jgi:HSP20 family molecular chaperone IbpA
MEIDYGRFTRQVVLGAPVDVEAAKATYKRGVLTILLPLAKKPASAERVEIPVSIRSKR